MFDLKVILDLNATVNLTPNRFEVNQTCRVFSDVYPSEQKQRK